MWKTLEFYFYLLKTSIRATMSKRGAFLIESGLMVLNNLIFFALWWIFFREFKTVAGWSFEDMILLMAIALGSYGIMGICFGGIKRLALIILNGDLDPFMTQPKNLLLHIAGSKSFSKGWGHLFTSIILLLSRGIVSPSLIPLSLLCILCGSLVFTSINIIANSLAFWIDSIGHVSKKYCDTLFLFTLYPTNIYSGLLQLVMFTLMPAGVITYLPVELVRNFTWSRLLLFLFISSAFFILSFVIFYRGLRRYESGNKFGVRL